jgi:hypothetical protein
LKLRQQQDFDKTEMSLGPGRGLLNSLSATYVVYAG